MPPILPPPPHAENVVRQGVVAVVLDDGRFLVIERSQRVTAPGAYCFPGGAIEAGESEQQALCREMMEELSAPARPLRRLWQSVTHRRVHLAWWLAELPSPVTLVPEPSEVASVHWMIKDQLQQLPELLASNRQFLHALATGEIELDGWR